LTALPSVLASGIAAKISPTPSTLPNARQHITSPSVLGDGQRFVAALLQNRRMALETPQNRILRKPRVDATRYQPSLLFQGRNSIDYNRNSYSGNLENLDVMVAYKEEAGNKVPLLQALNASYWNEYPIYENGNTTSSMKFLNHKIPFIFLKTKVNLSFFPRCRYFCISHPN
jgi:hypothetical protein